MTPPETAGGAVADLIVKANAGARLFYAMYHHPKAKEFFGSEFMTLGLSKAYASADDAYLPRK